jgi:hypothetical protein
MACKRTRIKSSTRCKCNGKFAKSSRCGIKGGGKRKRRYKSKAACVPGTKRKVGKGCGCKTRGGGFRIIKKRYC